MPLGDRHVRDRPPGALLAAGSLYVAALSTGAAFGVLFSGGAIPTMLGAALVAIPLASAGGPRALILFPGAAAYAFLAAYGPAILSPSGWEELPATVGADAYAALGVLYLQPAPYDPSAGLVLVVTLAATLVVGLAAFLAARGALVLSVALMGSTIGVLSTVSFEEGAGPFFAVFLVAAVLLLLLSGGGRVGGVALAAGALVVVFVLLLPRSPLAEVAIRPAMVDWQRVGASLGEAAGEAVGRPVGRPTLAVQADVGEYLNGAREVELFRVRSPEPLFWRGGTLDSFDGAGWESTARGGAYGDAELAPGVETRRVEQRVRVTGAGTNLVFGGYEITDVSGVQAGRRSDGSWVSERQLGEGSTYRVVSEVPQPTEAQLRGAGTDYPVVVRERYLGLPADVPGQVAGTAEKVRSGYDTGTPYDAARAVERYLVLDGDFTYDLNANYTRADGAIEEFLGAGRRGFCVQFATSMALVLRDMGVPSRVVYGATSGEEVAPDEYAVYGRNLHTWVEVYFPGVGWYPFNPTPGISMPSAMEANAPRVTGASAAAPAELVPYPSGADDAGSPGLRSGRGVPGSDERAAQADSEPPSGLPGPGPADPLLAVLALAGLVLGGVPLLKRSLARRGTPTALYRDVEARLTDALWPGGPAGEAGARAEALTPTERLVGAARAGGLDPRPFEELAGAYSEPLYSRRTSRDVREPHAAAVEALSALPLGRRLLEAFNPASLLGALRRRFRLWLRNGFRGGLRTRHRAENWPGYRSGHGGHPGSRRARPPAVRRSGGPSR